MAQTHSWIELQNDKQIIKRREMNKKCNDESSEMPLLDTDDKPKFAINTADD